MPLATALALVVLVEGAHSQKKRADDAKMHGQRAPPPSAATTPEVDIGRKQRLRSESGLPGWMRSVTQCGRPSGGRKPPFNNTDQTYATKHHDELHSRDDDDFDDASSVSTTASSEMNTDLLDTSLEACSFGSFAVGSRDALAGRRGKARKSGAARRTACRHQRNTQVP